MCYLRKLHNELVGIRILTRLLDQQTLFSLGKVRLFCPKQPRRNVLVDSTRKQHRLLLHKAYVGSEPCEIQVLDLNAIQRDGATGRVVPPF
jgi:hypothetical protein